MYEGSGQSDPLALAGREADGHLLCIFGHPEPFELFVDAAAGSCSIEPTDACCEFKVLASGQSVVEPGTLCKHPSPSTDGIAIDRRVESEHVSGTAVGSKDAIEESHRGRLASSVGTEQCQHLTPRHAEIETVKCDSISEGAREAARPNRQIGHGSG